MYKKIVRGLSFLIIPFLLCGCQLLPVEETLPQVPPIYSAVVDTYNQISVLRGDLKKIETFYCSYLATKSEDHNFTTSGLLIEKVFVTEGQKVCAGDILITMEMADIQIEIEAQEYELQVLQTKKNHILQNKELDLKKCDVQYGEEDRAEKRAEVEANYEKQLQDISDSIYIQELKMNDLKKKAEERQIRAGMDGTVTFVREFKEGDKTQKNQSVVSIKDFDTAVFRLNGKGAENFEVGDEVIIRSQNIDRKTTVVAAEQIGMEETTNGKQNVYFKPQQPDPTLDTSVRGIIDLILDQRENVLYLNKKAVKTMEGEPFVYMVNEEGLRIVQKISTGLDTGSYIEITGGLKEGDLVILE